MTARFPSSVTAAHSGSLRIAAAVAIVFGGALSIPTGSYAQTAAPGAASAAVAASATGGSSFTVQPGQSLNDAAIAMTGSRDRAVLARAAKAIFDANPNAFMGHDPSRLRLGAVLNLPAVDASGAPASAAEAAPASSSQAANGNGASASATSGTSAAATAATTAATSAAATTAATANAGASAAPAATAATTPGASATAAPEAAPGSAASPQATSATAAPSASAPGGTHSYTGSIQGSEAGAAAPGAAAATGAQTASQTRPSSLQQLLALKNRVLMELQKHGIGKPQGASGSAAAAPGLAQPPVAASSGAGASANAAHAAPAMQPANQVAGIPQAYLGGAAIVGAGLVALLAGLGMRRRRNAARAQEAAREEVAPVAHDQTPPAAAAVAEPVAGAHRDDDAAFAARESPADEAQRDAVAGGASAASAASIYEAEAKAEPETFDRASAEAAFDAAAALGADALPRESLDPLRDEARAAAAAELEQAAREEAPALRDEPRIDTQSAGLSLDEAPIRAQAPREPHFVEPIEAPGVASDAAQKPPLVLNLDPVPGSGAQEPAFEPAGAPAAPAIQLGHVEPAAQHAQLIEPLPEATDQTHDAHADDQVEQVSASLPLGAPPPLEPAAPIEFPRDAMRALDSIDDFALPPRSESSESSEPAGQVVTPPGSLTSQPVVSPEITAQQAVPQQAPQPGAADQIIAGTAGAAAVAGLGAARFGALKLDFDLELPPSPAQAVPTFTPEEVARIARNKLDLAVEYIDLGDVVGARTLINEVIESNDADSRADARALLSTLAPLS